MPRLRMGASLLTAALILSACAGSPDVPASPTGAVPGGSPATAPGAACPSTPDPGDVAGWGAPSTAPALTPLLVSNYIVCGQARILFLFLDGQQRDVSAPDRTASVSFFDLAGDPDTPVATVDGEFIWTIQDVRGMYIANVALPSAGRWGAEFTTQAPGSPAETIRVTFDVHDASPWVAVGEKAPASTSPTAADVGGDLSQLSTDTDPDPALYATSVADAIAAHRPFVLIFATPKFCTTAQCGPTLDRFKPVAAANPDVAFINVEPYQLQLVDGQLQPLLDAQGNLQSAPTTLDWGIYFEPWIFAVDGDGVVRGSYEIDLTDRELTEILGIIRG